jgi:hypothetical protein
LVPLALALATPARTRSTIMLRSNSANTPVGGIQANIDLQKFNFRSFPLTA